MKDDAQLRKIIGIFICMLLIVTVLPASGGVMLDNVSMSFSFGNTLFVGGSGSGNYSKIQDAVDNASSGDTVFVYDDSSPYYERVQINTSVSLIGEDRNTTVIDVYREGFGIYIRSDDVNIHEFTIQNSSGINYAAIRIDPGFGLITISDNIINDNDVGVRMFYSGDNITIQDNYFFNNNFMTIDVGNTDNTMILGNTIDHPIGTNPFDGIYINNGRRNNISGNTIKNCECGISLRYSSHNIVLNNEISSNEYDGIQIIGSNNQIMGNNISYNYFCGIEIQEGDYNVICHNNLEYNSMNAIDEGFNNWDDGEYGNYWSDYKEKYPFAKKLRKEGIWDTPYEIPSEPRGDNYDTCPLIKQWPDSVSKTIPSDNPFYYNFPLLSWLIEHFPNAFTTLRNINGLS